MLILNPILGPMNDVLFCPKTVFWRGISNAIGDLVLYLLKEGVMMMTLKSDGVNWFEYLKTSCHTKFYSDFYTDPVNFSKVCGRDVRALGEI